MKVAFDGRVIADHYPGIGRYAYNLARALAERADLTLVVNPGAANTRFDLETIPARRLPVRAGPAALAAQWRVPRALAGGGFGVYHSPYFLMPYAIGGKLGVRGQGLVPSLATFFDLTPLLPEAGYSPAARLAVRLGHSLAARAAARVIVLSRWAREAFAEALGLPLEKVEVIPPGVEAAFRPRPPEEIAAVRARLGLPEEYLLCVGTQGPHKNLPRLAGAYAALPPGTPPLLLAGPPGRRAQPAQAAIARLGLAGRVRFLSQVAEADLPALYSGARLFVQPSLAEGFGLPVLEALACGVPVACSTAPGLDEAAGEAAVRFDPLDVSGMAQALAALLGDDGRRRALREAGLAHAARFTWGRTAEATLAAYARTTGV